MTATPRRVTVEHVVDVPIDEVFAVLADPANHAALDGSGMLRGLRRSPESLATGAEGFSMSMRQAAIPYVSHNTITVFEPPRHIAWQTWGHLGRFRTLGGQIWAYDLTATTTHSTRVEHSYDWTAARLPRLIEIGRYPHRMRKAMTATLSTLEHDLGDRRPESRSTDA